MLILDFDFVEQGIAAGLPERESWRAAFGLTVSLVWIYTNLLRILAILQRRLIASDHRRPPSGPGPGSSGAAAVASRRAGQAPPRPPVGVGPRRVVRVLVRRLGLGGRRRRCRSSTQQAADAAPGAADLGAVELGARACSTASTAAARDRQHALAAERLGLRPRPRGPGRARPASRAAARRPASGSRRPRGGTGPGPNSSAGAAANSGPEDRAQRDGPAALLDDGDGLGGGEPARPGAGDLLERRRDRLDGAEVGAGADHDLDAGVAQPAYAPRRGGAPTCDGQHACG